MSVTSLFSMTVPSCSIRLLLSLWSIHKADSLNSGMTPPCQPSQSHPVGGFPPQQPVRLPRLAPSPALRLTNASSLSFGLC